MTKKMFCIAVGLVVVAVVGASVYFVALQDRVEKTQSDEQSQVSDSTKNGDVTFKTEVVASGLTKPWDILFADDSLLVSQNDAATISVVKDGTVRSLSTLVDVNSKGEGGLMGLAVDPDFIQTRFLYACYSTEDDVRVSRWRVDESFQGLSDQRDIVVGIPVNRTTFSGRHSGCRMDFGPDGYLWIGTGDAAIGSHPQDPQSLAGKILRVDRDGFPAPDNSGGGFDPRIYSSGHRNTQGIAFSPSRDFVGISVEHGPSIDDEVNLLQKGNFGWDPRPGYNESVSMTNQSLFSDSISAAWSAGDPTMAPSGATFVVGTQWKSLDGWLFVAMLKAQHVRAFQLADDGSVMSERVLFDQEFGRIRMVRQGPDGALYLCTDNGDGEDVIVRIIPQ